MQDGSSNLDVRRNWSLRLELRPAALYMKLQKINNITVDTYAMYNSTLKSHLFSKEEAIDKGYEDSRLAPYYSSQLSVISWILSVTSSIWY